jgi:hypothetical protein
VGEESKVFFYLFSGFRFHRDDKEVWRKAKRKTMRLVGFNHDYACVNWFEQVRHSQRPVFNNLVCP